MFLTLILFQSKGRLSNNLQHRKTDNISFKDTIQKAAIKLFSEPYDCGQQANQITCTLEAGTLTVSGEGDIRPFASNLIHSEIQEIIIGDGVISIGEWAFSDLENLVHVTMSDSVTNIKQSAFAQCIKLPSITIGKNVQLIGDFAFHDCPSLTSIDVSGNPYFSSIDGILYQNNGEILFLCPEGKHVINTWSSSVRKIAPYAFHNSLFPSLIIPDCVEIIEHNAFNGANFETITFGSQAHFINPFAFSFCRSLKAITVSEANNHYSTYNEVLYKNNDLVKCPALKTDFVWKNNVQVIGSNAFESSFLTCLTIPDTVTTIQTYAFYQCDLLKTLVIGDGVTSIREYALHQLPSLQNLIIGRSVNDMSSIVFGENPYVFETPPCIVYKGTTVFSDRDIFIGLTIHVTEEYKAKSNKFYGGDVDIYQEGQCLNEEGQCLNQEGESSNQEGESSNQEGESSNQEGESSNQEGKSSNQEGKSSNQEGTSSNQEEPENPKEQIENADGKDNEEGTDSDIETSTNKGIKIGVIVGISVGTFVCACIIVIVIIILIKRKKSQQIE